LQIEKEQLMKNKIGKKIVAGQIKQHNDNRKEFKVEKNPDRADERDVILVFVRDDRKVDKLDTDDLSPLTIAPKPGKTIKKIVWLTNFQVSNLEAGESYTVRMPKIAGGDDVVWYDGNTVEYASYTSVNIDGTPNPTGDHVEIVLDKGDPGTGWTTGQS
jgi:hypothetical protein